MARGMSSSLSGYRPTSTPKQQHSGIAPLRIYGLTPFSACVLALPLLRTPPLGDRPSVRLPTGWLTVGRVGLEYSSHPLGNVDMFQEVSPLFSCPGFISARAGALFGFFMSKSFCRFPLSEPPKSVETAQ